MSVERLAEFENFPAEEGQGKLVLWIKRSIYRPIANKVNWLIDRYASGSFDSSDSPIDVNSSISFYLVDTTAGDVTANVPSADINTGIMFHFKNTGTGILTVDADELIDNCDTIELIEMETITIVSDGTKYCIVP